MLDSAVLQMAAFFTLIFECWLGKSLEGKKIIQTLQLRINALQARQSFLSESASLTRSTPNRLNTLASLVNLFA